MRALIAEDNSITRLLLQATLTEWGYQVTAASDGAEAWQELQKDTTRSCCCWIGTCPEWMGLRCAASSASYRMPAPSMSSW